ncbi:hypothetical protein [Streptomyces sp. DH12]|nr:hypothetical protein [Streptomyces sp. DH12]
MTCSCSSGQAGEADRLTPGVRPKSGAKMTFQGREYNDWASSIKASK